MIIGDPIALTTKVRTPDQSKKKKGEIAELRVSPENGRPAPCGRWSSTGESEALCDGARSRFQIARQCVKQWRAGTGTDRSRFGGVDSGSTKPVEKAPRTSRSANERWFYDSHAVHAKPVLEVLAKIRFATPRVSSSCLEGVRFGLAKLALWNNAKPWNAARDPFAPFPFVFDSGVRRFGRSSRTREWTAAMVLDSRRFSNAF